MTRNSNVNKITKGSQDNEQHTKTILVCVNSCVARTIKGATMLNPIEMLKVAILHIKRPKID